MRDGVKTEKAPTLPLSIYPIPDAALDDRLGFVGTAGSGKTYNAGSGVERILAQGGRVVIPDPLGVWWGLGLKADGRSSSPWREEGRLIVFGGEHGDMPLTEHAGALIGETVAGMAESAILDLSDLGTKRAEVHFMLAFLTALYRHASNDPLHLIFDEADMWAPQQERDKGESPKLLGMMETVVRRGRIKGFIPWLITQRPAVLNKNVLSQVDGLVAFKLTASQDRAALGAWIEGQADRSQGREILDSLPTLQRGTGVVWAPARGILETAAFPLKDTFDSSRTPTRGERVERRDLKPLNLERLKGKLASLEEEQKANDPRALKVEVARLHRELVKAAKVKAAPAQIVHANAEEIAKARESGRVDGYDQGVQAAMLAVAGLGGKVPKGQRSAVTAPAIEHEPLAPTVAAEGVTGPQQRILDALAWWEAFGIERPTNEQVAFMSGYSPTSGGYKNPKSAAKVAGLLDYPSPGLISLTEAGRDKVEPPSTPTTREELHRRVNARLKGPQRAILAPLLAAWPDPIANDDLAAAAGYSPTSGGYKNPKSSLRTLGVVEYPNTGMIRAADWLFPAQKELSCANLQSPEASDG